MPEQIGIHATRKQREARIMKEGLRTMPFWRSRRPLRQPKGFRFKYPSHANVLTGKSPAEIFKAVYDALKAANTPFIGTSRKRFSLKNTRIFLVDLEQAKIIGTKQRGIIEESQIEHAPPHSLKKVQLSEKEIGYIETKTCGLHWQEANRRITEFVVQKIMKELQ